MPHWYWYGQVGCWFCKHENNCNQCKSNRSYMKKLGEKKYKGRNARAKKQKILRTVG